MRRFIYLLILILSIPAFSSASSSTLKLISVKGSVNTKEIGGRGLCVFSLWDRRKQSPVGADGTFFTMLSASRPQKLSITDERNMTRALAIACPDNTEKIIFDAENTARAILFQDPEFLENSGTVKDLYQAMSGKESFLELVRFFKENLSSRSLEELSSDARCVSLLEKCNSEVFGEDPAKIRHSLQEAKKRLEKLFSQEY